MTTVATVRQQPGQGCQGPNSYVEHIFSRILPVAPLQICTPGLEQKLMTRVWLSHGPQTENYVLQLGES